MQNAIQLTSTQIAILRNAKKLDMLLTPNERRIVKMAVVGKANKEIATMLNISSKTVEGHIVSVTRKARGVYGDGAVFRHFIVLELHCYYFLTDP